MKRKTYYVCKDGDRLCSLAVYSDGLPYAYKDGKWVFTPSLAKIQHEITDYEEISEEVANKLIGE